MSVSPTDARNDPRNAHLPLVNQPQTILGTTITFLVCSSPPTIIVTSPLTLRSSRSLFLLQACGYGVDFGIAFGDGMMPLSSLLVLRV
jgi:hypothetical protein